MRNITSPNRRKEDERTERKSKENVEKGGEKENDEESNKYFKKT